VNAADQPRVNPYVGLVPYTERDASWFFGRGREETVITANLRGSRLTLLYGASGVGKSSVLMAGVLPRLRAEVSANRDLAAHAPARRGATLDERAPFAIATFSEWRDPPLAPLIDAMRTAAVEAVGDEAGVEAWGGDESPLGTLRAWNRRVRMLLVILDQFEDYFLYHANERGPRTFFEEFPQIVNEPDLRANVLISLREDAWAKLDRFKGRIPRLFGNYVRIPYLDYEAGHEAIRGPIDEYNRRLAQGQPSVAIEEPLVEAVLHEVRTGRLALGPVDAQAVATASGDRIETPFLQLVMERLWNEATANGGRVLARATLADLGGAQAIVSGHLAEAMEALSMEDQAIAAELFHYLITPSKTKVAHDASDLAYWTKRPQRDVVRVLEELTSGGWRILRAVESGTDEPSTGRYEIFHDVLGEAILDWRKSYEQEREKEEVAVRVEHEEGEKRREQAQRHRDRLNRIFRVLAVVLSVLVVGLVVAMVFAFHERGVANHEREVARSRAVAASAVAQLPIDPELSLLLSREALADANTQTAADALRRSLSASHVRAALRGGRAHVCGSSCVAIAGARRRPPQSTEAGGVAFSPDGRRVAAISTGGAWLWEPVTGRVRSLATRGRLQGVAFSPDGRRLLEVGRDRGLWLLSIGADRAREMSPDPANAAAFSADGTYVAAAGVDATVVYRTADMRRVATVPARNGSAVVFSPDSRSVLVTDSNGDAILGRWRGARQASQRLAHVAAPASAAFSADGRFVAVGSIDGHVGVFAARTLEKRFSTAKGVALAPTQAVFSSDSSRLLAFQDKDASLLSVPDGRQLATLGGHADAISGAAFSTDGALVATASADGTIRVWDADVGSLLMELRGHEAAVDGVAFSPDDRFVASTSDDGTVRLWDVSTGRVLRGGDWILDAAFSGDGRSVATAGADGVAKLWTPATGAVSELAHEPGETLNSVAFSSRGDRVLLGAERETGEGGEVRLLDVRSGRALWVRAGPAGVLHVALSGDGRLALSVQRDGTADLWDVATGRPSPLLRTARGMTLLDGEFSADGRRVIITGVDGFATVIDVRARRPRVVYRGHQAGAAVVRAGAISPDGRWVATASARTVQVWDSRTGRTRMRLVGHTGPVSSVAFSPDGRRIVTASSDRTTRAWDAETGKSLAVMQNHAAFVDSVEFSPDGRTILSSGDDRTAKVYPCPVCAPTSELMHLAATRATRALTSRERREFIEIGS
jgi:WD40 repeat protein